MYIHLMGERDRERGEKRKAELTSVWHPAARGSPGKNPEGGLSDWGASKREAPKKDTRISLRFCEKKSEKKRLHLSRVKKK